MLRGVLPQFSRWSRLSSATLVEEDDSVDIRVEEDGVLKGCASSWPAVKKDD